MVSREKCRRVLSLLREKGMTLGSVESITGGLFSASLVSIPGASDVFKGALVTYDASLKESLAHVPHRLIVKHGVVSQEVANAMAIGARRALGVDVCCSFTGNAGPTKEHGRAPVGRVNMTISTRKGLVELAADFSGLRNDIQEKSVEMMLDYLTAIFA